MKYMYYSLFFLTNCIIILIFFRCYFLYSIIFEVQFNISDIFDVEDSGIPDYWNSVV